MLSTPYREYLKGIAQGFADKCERGQMSQEKYRRLVNKINVWNYIALGRGKTSV